ncbi:MAG: Skp family chaperone for outer membrane protein, partial [Myxococcota bacterium]
MRNHTNRVIAASVLALFAVSLAPAIAAAEGPGIAVVDVQKAIQSIPDGKKAKT